MVGDLERIISKVSTWRISPKEVVQLKRALCAIEPIKEEGEKSLNISLQKIGEQLNLCKLAIQRIEKEIVPEPPYLVAKGNVIASGVNEELDELRKISFSAKTICCRFSREKSNARGFLL